MALNYLSSNGNIEPGEHDMTWDQFINEFGYNKHRQGLINGMAIALSKLKRAGCQTVYIDGSFTNKYKVKPQDWDGCYLPTGINFTELMKCSEFMDITHPRTGQKKLFLGEIFPSTAKAAPGKTFLMFFQEDKYDRSPKGIIKIQLKNFPL